jgi:hypothetical protein
MCANATLKREKINHGERERERERDMNMDNCSRGVL